MRRSLARVLEDDARDPLGAQRVLEAALREEPSDAGLLEELERLAPMTGDWRGAAAVLREAVDGATDLSSEAARDLLGWLHQVALA